MPNRRARQLDVWSVLYAAADRIAAWPPAAMSSQTLDRRADLVALRAALDYIDQDEATYAANLDWWNQLTDQQRAVLERRLARRHARTPSRTPAQGFHRSPPRA